MIRFDGGTELNSEEADLHILTILKIQSERSLPYEQFQNSVERDMQTVIKNTATLIYDSNFLHISTWNFAANHFINVRNFLPNNNSSP